MVLSSTSQMVRVLSCAMVAALMVVLGGCEESSHTFTVDRKTVNGLPTVTANETASGEAKVVAIDYSSRSIALTGPKGQSEIFTVSKAVKNFDQIKQGDVVKVEYASQLNVSVRKVSEPLSTAEMTGVRAAPLGDMPGVVGVRSVETLADVTAIDYKTREVTMKNVQGKSVTLTADPKLKDLESVKVGDQVVFVYTEAVSISVGK